MAAMCPMSGCKAKHGLCVHEKMMLGVGAAMVVVGLLAAAGHFALGLL